MLTAAAPLNHEGENAWKEKRVPPSIMELFGGKLSTLVGWIDDVKKSQILTYLISITTGNIYQLSILFSFLIEFKRFYEMGDY